MEFDVTRDGCHWSADSRGVYLCFRTPSQAAAQQVLDGMDESKTYTLTIKRKTKRRSLDANGYYWKLCEKLAQATGLDKEEVYRNHIRGLSNYEVYGMREEAVEMFSRLWTSGHLGRFVETRAARAPGVVNVLAYYGSSDFDTAQMSRLIDNAIQDCRSLGIETRPQEEVDALLAQWDAPRNEEDKNSGEG